MRLREKRYRFLGKAFGLIGFLSFTCLVSGLVVGVTGSGGSSSVVIAGSGGSGGTLGGETLSMQGGSQTVPWGISTINARDAAGTVDESSIDVAVLDTGVDGDHEDLQGNIVWQYNERTDTNNSAPDYHGHGTFCAGIIGALANDEGVV